MPVFLESQCFAKFDVRNPCKFAHFAVNGYKLFSGHVKTGSNTPCYRRSPKGSAFAYRAGD